MNARSTWWLVATAVALFLFIVLVERRIGGVAPAAAPSRLLPELAPAQVTSVEVASAQETLRVERADFAWKLTAPVAYPAQARLIEAFLDACTRLTSRIDIPAADRASQPRGLAAYGLQPPRARVTLQQGGRSFELRLGSPSPVGDSVYAQVAGDDSVKVVEASLLDLFPRTVDEWRDPALVNLEGLAFNRLEVRAGARGFEVTRDPATRLWQITKPPPLKRANNPKINLILEGIQQWRVQQFVTDNPSAPLELYGLQPPQAELIIGQGTNDLVVVQFGGSPTNAPGLVHARRLSHTNVVLVKADWLEALVAPVSAFRDDQLLAFDPAQAAQIDVQSATPFALQRQTNGAWRVAEPFGFAADTELVREFLRHLGSLKIAEFVKDVVTEADLAGFGLKPPAARVTVVATSGSNAPTAASLLAELWIGTNAQPDKVLVRRGDEASVYAVSLGDVQQLLRHPFQMRDRRVWNFTTNHVLSVTTTRAGKSRKLVRDPKGDWKFSAGFQDPSEPVVPIILDEMLYRLGELRAVAWVGRGADKLERAGIPAGQTSIQVELKTPDGVKTLALDLVRRAPYTYGATLVDGEPAVFEFPPALYDELLQFLFPRITGDSP